MNKPIGIIGTGKIGIAIMKHLAGKGHPIMIGNDRDPATWQDTTLLFDGSVSAHRVEDIMLKAEIIFLAVPWIAVYEIAQKASASLCKIFIDATNNIINIDPFQIAALGELSSGEYVQKLFSTHHVVKAFNTLFAETLANPTRNKIGSTVIYLSGNEALPKQEVMKIITLMGFEPIDLGSLKKAAHLQEIGGQFFGVELIKVKNSKNAYSNRSS